MRALTNNTLVAISRYSNKVLKLATYMSASEQPMLLDNIYMIEDTTSQKDALELFQKDFDKTVDLIEKSHQLLSTVRADGIVEQLDNEIKDLNIIFEDKYDSVSSTIKLSSMNLNLKFDTTKEQIRNSIIKSVLGIDYAKFKDFIKNVDKIYKLDESILESEEDAVEYLSSLAYREEYDKIIEKIKQIAGDFSTYRTELGHENRNLIDNEITFTRSMIDSVVKNSTYMTKDSIEQIATPHKKNMVLVNKIFNLIKDNNHINAIEIDQDTNLKGVIDILEKTLNLNLNLKELLTLKCRKLGNYNANGLYLPRMHIAAVDITNPSALIHELTHAADISNPDLYNHILREEIINKYKQKIDIKDLEVQRRPNYYLNNEEVIARLGEISYLLNKHDFKKNETVSDFITRVSYSDKDFNSEDLNIAKPMRDYLKKSNIYFNFDKLNSEDLLELKEYFKSYFGVDNSDIRPVYSKFIQYEQKDTKKAKKSLNKYKDSPFVKLDPFSVVKALDYNYKHNVIPFDDLFLSIAENIDKIARRKKGMSLSDLEVQLNTTDLIYNWVIDKNDVDLKVNLLKSIYPFGYGARTYSSHGLKTAMALCNDLESFEKIASITKGIDNSTYLNDRGTSIFIKSHSNGLKNLLSKLDLTDVLKRIDKTDPLLHTILFSDRLFTIYSLANQNFLNDSVKLLEIFKDEKLNEIFDKTLNSGINTYISYTPEQTNYISEIKLPYSITGYLKPTENSTLSFSPYNWSRLLKQNIELIKKNLDEKGINNLISKEDGILKVNFDNINESNILGSSKTVKQSFRDIRKQILEKALSDLNSQQEKDLNNKKQDNSLISTLKTKIEEDKINESQKTEIDNKDKKPTTSPISQIKLF